MNLLSLNHHFITPAKKKFYFFNKGMESKNIFYLNKR